MLQLMFPEPGLEKNEVIGSLGDKSPKQKSFREGIVKSFRVLEEELPCSDKIYNQTGIKNTHT